MLVISSSAPSLTGFSRSDLSFLSSSSPPIPPTYLEIDSSLFSLPPDTLSSYITVLTNLHNLSHLLPSPETPLTHSSLSALQDVYKAVSNSATQHLLPSPITTVCITGGCEILGLPEHIRAHFPTARILTNLCSPFPCLERWRELPQWFRGSLIKGLCSSTLVSCESDYSLTELTRCCEMEGVTPPHLFSALRGVDTSLFELTGCRDGPLKSGEWDIMASHARLDHLLKSLQGKAPPADGGPPLSIVTVDEDGSPDVLLKLSAADALLATHPTLVGRVQFIFIVTKPPSHMNPSAVLSINEAVGKLNGLHTSPTYNPCSLLRMATPSTDYLAGIFSVCCVGFFPASIEGSPLMAMAYVASQQSHTHTGHGMSSPPPPTSPPGTLIISSFSTGVKELGGVDGALTVNLADTGRVVDILAQALYATSSERLVRHSHLLATVRANSSGTWAAKVQQALLDVPI